MNRFFILAAAASLMAGCAQDTLDSGSAPVGSSARIQLVGTFAANTRTAFEDAQDGIYRMVWSRGDEIGIFSLPGSETSNINEKAVLLRTTAGLSEGIFTPEDQAGETTLQLPTSGSDSFLIYYPYAEGADLDIDDDCFHGTIAELQSQNASGDRQVGRNGFSWAKADVDAGEARIDFTLKHEMAYIRFVVSSTEFSSYGVRSVQLFDQKGEAALSGAFAFDPETETVTPTEGRTSSSAKVRVEGTAFAALGGSAAELYLTVLPCDLSSSDLYAVVTFENAARESVVIPVQLDKTGNLPQGSMTTIELSNLSTSDNSLAWYEPIEPRSLADGWCYGPQNTYLVERSATADEWNEVEFSVKARGDFSKVREPKYYGLMCSGEVGGNGLVRMPDMTTAANEAQPAHAVGSDYTIKVIVAPTATNTGSSAWGVVSIYDEEYNVLWSYMIWTYVPTDRPADVTYPNTGYTLLNRNIGARLSATADQLGSQGSGPYGAVFQWGRPAPFMYSNSQNNAHYVKAAVLEETDLAYVMARPSVFFTPASGDYNSDGDWKMGDHRNDLWGAVNTTDAWYDPNLTGVKTIYDPCPEGYRVVDGAVLSLMLTNGERNEKDHTDITPADQVEFSNVSTLRYSIGSGLYDYWPYNFAHWNSQATNWGNRAAPNAGYLYWGNSNSGVRPGTASVLQGAHMSSGWSDAKDATKSQGFSVRCQKDENGR